MDATSARHKGGSNRVARAYKTFKALALTGRNHVSSAICDCNNNIARENGSAKQERNGDVGDDERWGSAADRAPSDSSFATSGSALFVFASQSLCIARRASRE